MGSQGDVYQELASYHEGGAMGGAKDQAGHQYQLSYEMALDNVLTPFAPSQPISPLTHSMTNR